MMREEFVALTKVEVSHRFYTERIEPLYMAQNEDKQTFCAEWLKANKSNICKANILDIGAMNRDVALLEATRAEYYKMRDTENDLKHQVMSLGENLEVARRDAERFEKENKQFTSENKALREKYHALEEKLDTAAKVLSVKDGEIMKLKAMLFDMLMQKSA